MSMISRSNVRPAVLHKVRQLSNVSNPETGWQSAADLDAEIGSLLLQGYRLVSTHYLSTQTDQRYNATYVGILYILQLEQSEIERMRKESTAVAEKN